MLVHVKKHRRAAAIAIGLATAAAACPVFAENFTGYVLLEACAAAREDPQYAFCLGFVTGAIAGMEWGAGIGVVAAVDQGAPAPSPDERPGDILLYCLPSDIAIKQIKDSYVAYLTGHANDLQDDALTLLHLSLGVNYHCDPS